MTNDEVVVFNKSLPFKLKITVKSGNISGGGLAHDSFVEISIDGTLFARTEILPPPSVWNTLIVKKFATLEPRTPTIISFSAYKKRWTSSGYKLVGSTQFALSELYGTFYN